MPSPHQPSSGQGQPFPDVRPDSGAGGLVVDLGPSRGLARLVLLLLTLALMAAGAWLADPASARARAPRPKAVMIVGHVDRRGAEEIRALIRLSA